METLMLHWKDSNDEAVNLASATATLALDNNARENTGGMQTFQVNQLDGHHANHLKWPLDV